MCAGLVLAWRFARHTKLLTVMVVATVKVKVMLKVTVIIMASEAETQKQIKDNAFPHSR